MLIRTMLIRTMLIRTMLARTVLVRIMLVRTMLVKTMPIKPINSVPAKIATVRVTAVNVPFGPQARTTRAKERTSVHHGYSTHSGAASTTPMCNITPSSTISEGVLSSEAREFQGNSADWHGVGSLLGLSPARIALTHPAVRSDVRLCNYITKGAANECSRYVAGPGRRAGENQPHSEGSHV